MMGVRRGLPGEGCRNQPRSPRTKSQASCPPSAPRHPGLAACSFSDPQLPLLKRGPCVFTLYSGVLGRRSKTRAACPGQKAQQGEEPSSPASDGVALAGTPRTRQH